MRIERYGAGEVTIRVRTLNDDLADTLGVFSLEVRHCDYPITVRTSDALADSRPVSTETLLARALGGLDQVSCDESRLTVRLPCGRVVTV